jgi:RNA polymerase sigma factor (sigma-70 family)
LTTNGRRWRKERSDGLAVLYRELKDELLTVAVHLTGSRASGEDLLHDVFVAFARRDVELDGRDEARRYLVKSLVHRARDVARRHAPPAADEGALERAASSDSDGDPLAHVTASEETKRVTAMVLALPQEQRDVVTLHLHGGLAFREIAALLSISINTATSRYRYALLALKRQLAPRGVPK